MAESLLVLVWRVLLFHVDFRGGLAISGSSLLSKDLGKACVICSSEMVSVLKFLGTSVALNFSAEHMGLRSIGT